MYGAHNKVPRLWLDRTLGHLVEIYGAQIRGHDDNRVPKVHYTSLAICEASIVEDLQEEGHEFAAGFFNLVDQDDGVRFAADVFGKLTTFAVPNITRRGADEATDRMLLRIFGTVDTNHGVRRIKE